MIESYTLPNGVRLLTEDIPYVRSCSLGFFVGVGSRHEAASENGTAHFIEHMLFKGTSTRSAAQLASEMDAIGGQFNAYTTKENTCFYGRCLDEHLGQAMDILTDMLFHSNFDQSDVETERGVILEEIGMYRDSPEDLVVERMGTAVFQGSSLAMPILGTADTLAGMTGDCLRAWQQANYRGSNLVAVLAGHFTQAHTERLLQVLGEVTPGPASSLTPASYHPAVTVEQKDIEQNHLVLAYPGLSFLDHRREQLTLLNSILGGGNSSRLFQVLREQMGLCYTVYSFSADHMDTGFAGVYTAVSPEQERPALEIIRQVVTDFAEHGPTQEELDRNREQTKASLVMGMESVQSHMSHLGSSVLLYGRQRPIDEIIASYNAVTVEQVRDLSQQLFRPELSSLSAVGQISPAEEYQEWLLAPAGAGVL